MSFKLSPYPESLASPKQSEQARKELIKIVNEHQAVQNNVLQPPDAQEKTLKEIDRLTYLYFGLSDDEITLLEDAVEHILPAAQPNRGSFPDLWKTCIFEHRESYASQLKSALEQWFDSDRAIAIKLVGYNQDFGILCLQLLDELPKRYSGYSEDTNVSFSEALDSVSVALENPIAQNFQSVPDMRIFVGNKLFLIKPMQRRFWLRSTALADADNIASDLESSFLLNHKGRHPS